MQYVLFLQLIVMYNIEGVVKCNQVHYLQKKKKISDEA